MSQPADPFVGPNRVPWLRPLAQVLRVLALGIGAASVTRVGWTVPDVAVAVVLVSFIAWRAAPQQRSVARLRDVMALEVVLATLGVVVTGGLASPWIAAQFVPVGLAALGLPATSAGLLAVVTLVVDAAASLPVRPDGLALVTRGATLALVVGFAVITRGVLLASRSPHDEALGRLDVLWSVRAMLEGLHTEARDGAVTFQLDEAVDTLRSASPALGAVEVLGLFAHEDDGTLRLLHGVGLPDRPYRVRDLPGRVGAPRRDGVPVGVELASGGVTPAARRGVYVWLPVAEHERAHLFLVEHPEAAPGIDDLVPELAGLAEPLAVTVHNATWFARVSHLGVDEERQRIAARLHDQFAQQLAVVSMELELAARRHPEDAALRELRVEVRDSLTGLRDTMVELRATVDEEHPLEHVLVGLVDRLRTRHGVVASLEHDVSGRPLSSTLGQQLLRIAQEVTARAVGDREATAVYVRYVCDDEHVVLEVSDDGEAPADLDAREGLAGVVRDRVEAIGATLVLDVSATGLPAVRVEARRNGSTP